MFDLLYQLNSRDEISAVGGEWLRFAVANDGRGLAPPDVVGRRLWEFIHDIETEHIYRLLHDRVRTGGAPVRLQFRCDAPARRRLLELDLSPAAEGGLTYQVRTVAERERAAVPLLEPRGLRSDGFVTICSWCKRVAAPGGAWLEVEAAVAELSLFTEPRPPQLTHGACGDCVRALDETLALPGGPAVVTLADL